MREIEFRVWLKNCKKMRIVCGIDFSSNEVDCSGNDEYLGWYNLHEYELMQYTGLKDKNGVKIFEGDIVKRTVFYRGEILESIKYVEFEKGCFILKNSPPKNYLFLSKEFELEVIGNIYENPELLGE